MAFDMIHKLGEEKVLTIKNQLLLGVPALALARTIKTEWKDFPATGEKTLAQMLNRYKSTLAGPHTPDQNGKLAIRQLKTSDFKTLDSLVAAAKVVEVRIDKLVGIEAALASPSTDMGRLITTLVESYAGLIKDIQKMRFELGMDRFVGMATTVRSATETTKLADGSIHERVLMEAYTAAERVFDERGITDGDV